MCMYVYTYVCMYVCKYICMYMCMYAKSKILEYCLKMALHCVYLMFNGYGDGKTKFSSYAVRMHTLLSIYIVGLFLFNFNR